MNKSQRTKRISKVASEEDAADQEVTTEDEVTVDEAEAVVVVAVADGANECSGKEKRQNN